MSSENSVTIKKEDEKQSNVNKMFRNYENLEQLTKDGYKTLMEAIRTSNALPNGRDWNYYNTHEVFTQYMDNKKDNLLKLMNQILRFHNVNGNIRHRILDDKTELIVEANDVILEQVANNIDELNGIRKTVPESPQIQTVSAQIPINGSWNRNTTYSVASSINGPSLQGQSISLLAAKNIVRPQTFFKDKINNSGLDPFEPRIKEKPNSLKPLAIFLEETERGEEFSHPYQFELERFEPTAEQLLNEEPIMPKKVEDTPLIEVYEEDQLNQLLETLRNCKEFAVDLEHHSYRTFMGITCLMQISTRDCDYLIDTLTLRDKLHILNEVFTKPTILKIFHGADCDIQWLQRDLSIYVVNMFDTHQAAKMLQYSSLSLAALMERFCHFLPNKKFQLADWRIRPLPDELKRYAREDTHYLFYIYQHLKRELYEKANGEENLLRSVIKKSTEICEIRYFKPNWTETSYMDFYRKCKRGFDNRQMYALQGIYNWRDKVARDEDESTGYVLPNHMLLQICERLPREMQGILACCNPIPPLVRANLLDLHKIILKAREQPVEKPILKEDTRARGTTKQMSKINIDNPLYCPHDLTKTAEFTADLPTLINRTELVDVILNGDGPCGMEKLTADCSIFTESSGTEIGGIVKYLGPFERYKMVRPFVQAEDEKRREEEKNTVEEKSNEVQQETESDGDPTVEKRVEAIREHFLDLSRQFSNNPLEGNEDLSLVQMGGSKKRKRSPSRSNEVECDEIGEAAVVDFHTTVPKMGIRARRRLQKDMKRRKQEARGNNQNVNPKQNSFNNKKQAARGRGKMAPNRVHSNVNSQQNASNNRNQVGRGRGRGRVMQNRQKAGNSNVNHQQIASNDGNGTVEGQGEQRSVQNQVNQQQNGFNKKKGKGQQNTLKRNKSQQGGPNRAKKFKVSGIKFEPPSPNNHRWNESPSTSNQSYNTPQTNRPVNQNQRTTWQNQPAFVPYDYASVDFRQFQGGANHVRQNKEFRGNFRGRGRNKQNYKNFNKSTTFGKGRRN